jgi:hypothetical protein
MANHYFTVTGATINVSIGYTAIFNPAPLEPASAPELPYPAPTASSTPSAEQPQEQVIYTIGLIGAVSAIAVIVFVAKFLSRSRKEM